MSLRKFGSNETDSSSSSTLAQDRYRVITSGVGRFGRTAAATDDGTDDSRGPLGLNLLHSPSDPLIDLIFVHGLGGGSRKTWSKTNALSHYWPQEWLPKDPAFINVRVHSFGYDSNWVKGRDNCLDIHHFGKSLLGEISISPFLQDTNTPIVFIGHSMGGLVVKKAYMLARQDTIYETLIKRFHTIYFLATPHRGSDSAKFLNDILHLAFSSRAYITNLEQSSETLRQINDEFRKYSADIELWSFYETQKLSMGLFSKLIVNPDSAILGYRDEKQMPMNADHRSICKFETPTDPNYLTLRNAIATTVNNILKLLLQSKKNLWRSYARDLETYLEVSSKLEDDLISAEDTRMSGTCEWFSRKKSYLKWKNFSLDAPRLLWVNGSPAAGKSILAGYVIDQLQQSNASCSYFFFKYGDKSKSRLSACLRSLAFQMAYANVQVREMLLEMQKHDIKIDVDNERTLWRKLFLSGIFQTEFPQHYWIIDALDECVNFTPLFDLMLAKLDDSIPLRILITSRDTSEIEKYFCSLGTHRFQSETISVADTLPDIKLLVEAKVKFLTVKNEGHRAALVEKILAKSKGSFLWTVLVINELINSYDEEEINKVLEDVPRDMAPLYQRTLRLMSQATRGKKLTKTILTWATCATRPLTMEEFEGALTLDLKENLLGLENIILALCGQLVTIDKFGKVQMLHETAREFLLTDDLESEFAINKTEAHTQIARVCLTYLTGEEMRPPRTNKRVSSMVTTAKRNKFSAYACAAFSYHLAKADPLANDILILVNKFLKSNVLSWIEMIAETKNLISLIRAARNLRIYLSSCATERSPLGTEMQTLRGWATDLIRITTKFADALVTSPTAIYSLILPFCPTDSTVYKTGNQGRRLSIVGISNAQWDDRLSCIDFHQNQTSAICHGDEFLAVGLTNGTVALYHATSCQEYKLLNHGEAIKYLHFKSRTSLLASCGMKTIRIWDVRTGEIIYNFQAPQRPIGLTIDGNLLVVPSSRNYLASWDLDNNGAQSLNKPWNDTGDNINSQSSRPPCAISISVSHKMLAIAYSGRPITLWDLEEDSYYGSCGKKLSTGETSTHLVTALVFNPNPNIGLLAASYLDGELIILDPFNNQDLEGFRADCHTLAASPDGRLLAGGAGSGTIRIYEFDTLKLLYQVKSSNIYIKQLAFSNDSLHLADIRGSQCNIWEPTVLIQEFSGDDSSEATLVSGIEAITLHTKIKINSIVLHPNEEVVFCGKDDGSVSLYDLKTGVQLRILYQHKSLIRTLSWWTLRDAIMSIDASNGIFAWNVKKQSKDGWVAEKLLFQSRLDCGRSIIQVLPCEIADKFILSTRESDHFWSIEGHQEDMRIYSDRPGIRKWLHHQQSPLHMLCIEGTTVRAYAWSDWSEVVSVTLDIEINGLQLKSVISCNSGPKRQMLIEFSEQDGSAETRNVYLFDIASFKFENVQENPIPDTTKAKKQLSVAPVKDGAAAAAVSIPLFSPQLTTLAQRVAHIVGINNAHRLVFLDTQSWICSVDLGSLGNNTVSYLRHFFVPYDWFSGIRDIICAVVKRDILFARNDEVAVIKGGLEFAEIVNLEMGVKGLGDSRRLLTVTTANDVQVSGSR